MAAGANFGAAPTVGSISLIIAVINATVTLGTLLLFTHRKDDGAELIETSIRPRNLRNFAIYYFSSLASRGVLHISILFINATFNDTETALYALGVRFFGVLLLPFSFLMSYSTKQIVSRGMDAAEDGLRIRVLGLTVFGVLALFAGTPLLRWFFSIEVLPAVLVAAILAAGTLARVFTFAANVYLQFRVDPPLHLVFTAASIVALVIAALPSAELGVYYFAACMSIYNVLPGAISFFYLRGRKEIVP